MLISFLFLQLFTISTLAKEIKQNDLSKRLGNPLSEIVWNNCFGNVFDQDRKHLCIKRKEHRSLN